MPPTTISQPSISTFGQTSWSEPVIQFFVSFGDNLRQLGQNHTFLSLIYFLWALLVIIVGVIGYLLYLYIKLQKEEHKKYYAEAEVKAEEISVARAAGRWQEIVGHLKSEKENDWKIAILEADSVMAELFEGLGYVGENLGERLKNVQKGDVLTIDSAWAAHKMRNRIAHEGMGMSLTRREAGETLSQFEQVFREFNYI